jgi:hypothetical protein
LVRANSLRRKWRNDATTFEIAHYLNEIIFNAKFSDLGPFRNKIRQIVSFANARQTYGWTVEMQLKVLKQKMTYLEIPVRYKNRIGVSKFLEL